MLLPELRVQKGTKILARRVIAEITYSRATQPGKAMQKMKNKFSQLAAIAVMALTVGTANAQDAAEKPEVNPEDNWVKVCDTLKSGEKACIVRQVIFAGTTKIGAFTFRDDPSSKNRYFVQAEMPLAISLLFNLKWQIDGAKPFYTPWATCDPTKCTSHSNMPKAFLEALKRGAKLTMTAKNRAFKDLPVAIDLNGFTAVYEGDKFLTPTQFQSQLSGQSALQQQLQEAAEKIRQEKQGSETPATSDGN